MSDSTGTTVPTPRLTKVRGEESRAAQPELAPRLVPTGRTDPIVPVQPRLLRVAPAPRRSRVVSWALAGLGIGFAGWLIVDAYWWLAAAFERSTALGALAATAVIAGVAGAGTIIARELTSLWRLRDVETVRRRFSEAIVTPRDARGTIAGILAVVPREPGTQAAIERYQRQVQPHHSVAQQVEILSRTVLQPLDARAEENIRAAVLRAFGITAISPTALSDALFFLAVAVRMVRRIAGSYGHRPTTAATIHLLRRLVVEAGRLGAVDLAGTTLAQQLGGAMIERVGASAAESFYASYRMARLGVIVMDMCRPVPFSDEETPKITALVTNVIRQRGETK
jgi:putative membrane protein